MRSRSCAGRFSYCVRGGRWSQGKKLIYLGLVRPLIAKFVEDVNVAKGAEDATHEP